MSERKNYHHGDLQAALIEAGLKVLKDEGLASLSLRRVAREAAVSPTATYRHFKDKQALLAAISEAGFAQLHRMLEVSRASDPTDLDKLGGAYLQFAQKEPDTYRLMFTHSVLCEGEPPESLSEIAGAAFGSLVETIAAGQEAGLIARSESGELALAAWSLLHGVSMLLIDGILENGPYGELPPERILALCQQFLREGWKAKLERKS